MLIVSETVVSKKNKAVLLRSPRPEDAKLFIDAMTEISASTAFLLNTPESFRNKPVEEEMTWIERYNANPRGLIIAAEFEGRIVGILDFICNKSEKTRHRGILGISLRESMRGEGLGQLLFKKLINEARKIDGLTQMELSVFSENHAAYHLYKKVGFKEVARRPQAYKQPDGSFCDEVIMIMPL